MAIEGLKFNQHLHTGVGWALGIGRVGSIVGPLVGGMMLARHISTEMLLLAAAVPAVIACGAAFILSRPVSISQVRQN